MTPATSARTPASASRGRALAERRKGDGGGDQRREAAHHGIGDGEIGGAVEPPDQHEIEDVDDAPRHARTARRRAAGVGVAAPTMTAMTPHQRQTRAEVMNLSPALLTSEFHNACISAAESTAVITIADTPALAWSQIGHAGIKAPERIWPANAPPPPTFEAPAPICRGLHGRRKPGIVEGAPAGKGRMNLTPREKDKLLIAMAAMVARRRLERGVKLNHPEAIALITDFVVEGARDGRTWPN